MSRLLFAAARGARIEWQTVYGAWKVVDDIDVTQSYPQRIHPDDAHLQYGPISTALRKFAETGSEPDTLSGLMAMEAYYVYECEFPFVLAAEWPHAQMFALILAEALADEGM